MEENNNIDKLFQSAIEGFTMEPPEKSWDSLQSDLDKRRKSMRWKNRFIMFSVSIILLTTSFTAYMYFSNDNSVKPENTKAEVASDNKKNNSQNNGTKIISSQANQQKQTLQDINSDGKSISADNNFISSPGENKSTDLNTLSPSENNSAVITGQSEKNEKANAVNNSSVIIPGDQKNIHISESQKSVVPEIAAGAVINPSQPLEEKTPASNKVESNNSTTEKTSGNEQKNQAPSSIKTAAAVSVAVPQAMNNKNISGESAINSSVKENTRQPETGKAPDATGVQNNSAQKVPQEKVPAEKGNETPVAANNQAEQKTTTENTPAGNPVVPVEQTKPETKTEIASASEPEKTSPVAAAQISPQSNSDSSESFLKKMASNLSAEIFYSPDYVSNRLEVNYGYNGTGSQNLNDYNNQKANFSFSTGMLLRYDIGSKWSVSSGAAFSTFEQTAVYNTIQVVADSVYHEEHGHNDDHHHGPGHDYDHHPPNGNNDHHYIIQTPCGSIDLDHEPTLGNTNVHDGDTLAIKTETNESIHFIYIPVTVRYQFVHHKFSYFIEAGAAFNIVHYDAVEVKINDATESNYVDGLKNSNYSLLLGAGVQYNFYKGLSTFIKPSLRYSITPINQNNPVNSYPDYLGIAIGFSIHF